MFKKDRPLPPTRFRECWSKGGLQVTGFQCFPNRTWAKWLRERGLLAVGAVNALPSTGLHLRVLHGLHAEGQPSDAYYMMGPATVKIGSTYGEPIAAFTAKFETAQAFASVDHFQIAYYP